MNAPARDTAFEELYRKHQSGIRSFLRSFTNLNHDEVEDVLQETFIRVSCHDMSLIEHPVAWMRTVARNRVCQYLTSRQLRLGFHSDAQTQFMILKPHIEPEPTKIEHEVRWQHRKQWLQDIISKRPPTERETLRLFYIEEMPTGEIAKMESVTKSAITMRLHRFRRETLGMV